jgi:hypothetical protein
VKATLIPPLGKAIKVKTPGVPVQPVQARRNDLLLLRGH